MGHSGAIYLLQEIVNALYETLFNFLPLNRRTVVEEPTQKVVWSNEANTLLHEMVKKAPFISQISFGREVKRKAEVMAIKQGLECVTIDVLKMVQ